jgi:hypothetical protein
MSSRFRLSCIALSSLLALGAAACVDPKKTFDDFGGRVLDAAPVPDAMEGGGGVFDVTGPFLLSIATTAPVPVNPIRFLVNATFTEEGDGGTVDLTIQPLAATPCGEATGGELVGEEVPIDDIVVAADGTFEVTLTAAVIDGAANPLLCGTPITADITLAGTIVSEDSICGAVSGMVTAPLSGALVGSFGAVGLDEPVTVGDANLPEAQTGCQGGGGEPDAGPDDEPDAGVPDAGTDEPDAGEADAAA